MNPALHDHGTWKGPCSQEKHYQLIAVVNGTSTLSDQVKDCFKHCTDGVICLCCGEALAK